MAKQWIQKATASIKRRGTKGKCTPITKPGCTGRAKALAKTFKKMAKKRKAQGGITLAKNPETDPKNAIDPNFKKEPKYLSDVTKRETAGEALKGFYKKDYLKADSAKTKTGKVLRKVGNTAIKAAFTPQALMATALRTGSTAKANKEELKKIPQKKMGGKVTKKKK